MTFDRMVGVEVTTPLGTYACDICGKDYPHHHTDEEAAESRIARPIFEDWFASSPRPLTRYGGEHYLDGEVQRAWIAFRRGWSMRNADYKRLEKAITDALYGSTPSGKGKP